MPDLSTRSYAVLGLLAIRDWTTYDLARQMDRGVGDIWPTSRSMVFEEPKSLVSKGFATSREEPVGRRTRTWYGITAKGRRELKRWLEIAGAPPAMHFEGLLKVLLSDLTSLEAARSSLDAARDWALETRATGRDVATEYAAGDGPFDERARVVSLTFAFLWEFADLVDRWSTWATAELDQRPPSDPYAVFRNALLGQSVLTQQKVSRTGRSR